MPSQITNKKSSGKGSVARSGSVNVLKNSHAKSLIKGNFTFKVSKNATNAMIAGMNYFHEELVQLTLNQATADGKKTLKPTHIATAIRNDSEFNQIGNQWIIKGGGFKKTYGKKATASEHK